MANWIGRGKGRAGRQPTLQFNSGPGMGSGRPGLQLQLQLNSGIGLGSGRAEIQPVLQAAFGYTTGWEGRGGGRSPFQPVLQPATGQTMSNWAGRGGGRGISAISNSSIEPSRGAHGYNWVGRGGGRSPVQPRIASATVIAAQRAMLNQASNMVAGAIGAAGGALGGFVGTPVMGRELEDPIGSYVFALEINSVEIAHFSECSGIKSSTEVYEIKEGGVNHATHKLPGQSKWDNLVLRYGVTSDMSMLGLREYILNDEYAGNVENKVDLGGDLSSNTTLGGLTNSLSSMVGNALGGASGDPNKLENKRFSGSIVIKNNRMQEMVRYTFKQAWIVSWEGPKMNSEGSDLAIESVEIAHHGVEVNRSYVTKVPMGWV